MPRSLWNGTVSFGLVNVPVKLFSAVEDKTVHFHEVHLADGSKVEHRRFCSKEDEEVDYDEVVKGYEVKDGEYVVVDKEELKAAAGSRAHVLDVEHFVCATDIDPVFFEKPYVLGAGKDGEDAYRLLHDALVRTGRAAVGRFTFHDRERVAVLVPRDDVIALHTLRFADELVDADDLDHEGPGRGPGKKEVDMAGQLVETLHTSFDPSDYEDEHRKAVLALIARKARGEAVSLDEDEEPEDDSGDLMAALQASVGKGSGGAKGKGRGRKAKAGSR
ncbi:Ku protein [Conexibacter sp. SYSU D00693]|uniref:non-homologous end joining protein Ku n=1 Tax=Conexibacter sp. SYSU D00693 TaxID=2812560 RepID=UPI00196B75B8|nr:Ku protein [Conexibacter sp. SYSU D00693]